VLPPTLIGELPFSRVLRPKPSSRAATSANTLNVDPGCVPDVAQLSWFFK
jgi:hypothetical protein